MKHLVITKRASVFMLVIIAIAIMLSHYAFNNYEKSFRNNHISMAHHSVQAISSELRLLLNEMKREARLFAQENNELLWQLSQNPESEEIYSHIKQLLTAHIPKHYSYTLSDVNGQLLYDDLGKDIGPLCRKNIHQNAEDENIASIVVHPGPEEHHFDIMVHWSYQGSHQGVFMTTYRLNIISKLLEVGQIPQHELILNKSDDPSLIDVTASGGRDKIVGFRPITLNGSEISRIAYSQHIEGTEWILRDLFDENLMPDYRLRLWRPLIGAWVIVLLLTGTALFFIYQLERAYRILANPHESSEPDERNGLPY